MRSRTGKADSVEMDKSPTLYQLQVSSPAPEAMVGPGEAPSRMRFAISLYVVIRGAKSYREAPRFKIVDPVLGYEG